MPAPGSRPPTPPLRYALGGESAKTHALHPGEKGLIFAAAALLIFQPWALGGMDFWTQWVALALATASLVIALLPRNYPDIIYEGNRLRLIPWIKLRRFPFFWLGLAYFGFVLIQIINPAWRYVVSEQGWWLEVIKHIPWLPHGVADTPAIKMNGARTLLIQGTAWLLVCALWIGITRRKTVRILLTTVTLNGAVIALVVLLQRLIGAKQMLWLFEAGDARGYFAGSFFYKNHAGAFFLLILATCLGLAWWHAAHAERRLQKSHPGLVFLFIGTVVAVALMFTFARATTALGGAFIVIVAVVYVLRGLFRQSGGPPKIVTALTALFGVAFIALCVVSFNTDKVWAKFGRLFEQDKFLSVTSRQIATKATLDMAQDSLITGHGAGSFRFLFPRYQQHYPEIFTTRVWNAKQKQFVPGRRLYWEHAHNDYAEWLAENGLIGAGLAAIGLILIGGAMWRGFMLSQPAPLLVLGGPVLVAISAWVDFPMHNPAVLTTACALTALSLRWSLLSRR